MKEKISRNKISRHYKSFFGLENMGLGENDNLMIDWGESLVNDFCNQEVEKRIAERMPSDEEIRDELCRHLTAEERETDVKIRQKVAYLQRLLTLRLRFMKYATGVDVTHDGDTIFVRWAMDRGNYPKGCEIIDYEMIEFPVAHLSKRIRHYLAKFRAEYLSRHKNLNQ